MLRTNLATRPFYNERAAHLVLAAAGAAALAGLVDGGLRAADGVRERAALSASAEAAEHETAQLADRTAALRRTLAAGGPEVLADDVEDANRLVEQRTFSWTAFFNLIDRTLPGGVMLTAVRPAHGADGIVVALDVVGRRVADIDGFIERLEATGAFADVLAREEEQRADGMYRARVSGRYLAAGGREASAGNGPGP